MGDILSKSNIDEAINKYEKSLRIYEALFGPSNMNNVIVINNIAGLYLTHNNFSKAEEYCHKNIEIIKVLG